MNKGDVVRIISNNMIPRLWQRGVLVEEAIPFDSGAETWYLTVGNLIPETVQRCVSDLMPEDEWQRKFNKKTKSRGEKKTMTIHDEIVDLEVDVFEHFTKFGRSRKVGCDCEGPRPSTYQPVTGKDQVIIAIPQWRDKNGKLHEIAKMDTSHLFSAMRVLERAVFYAMQESLATFKLDSKTLRKASAICTEEVKKYQELEAEFDKRLKAGQVKLNDLLACGSTKKITLK